MSSIQNMIICSRFLSAFLVIIKNTAFLITPLYQKNGYKCRKARLLPGLCLQSGEGAFAPSFLTVTVYNRSDDLVFDEGLRHDFG